MLNCRKIKIGGGYFFLLFLGFSVSVSFGQSLNKDSLKLPVSAPNISINDSIVKEQLKQKATEKLSGAKNPFKTSKSALAGNLKSHIPNTNVKKIISPSLKTKGSIALGYEYGILPYAMNAKVPSGNYKTEGEMEFSAFNFPLKLNFYYSDVRYNTGLSNHFSIKYDIEAYKQEMLKKIAAQQDALKKNLTDMQSKDQLLQQKLLYMENLKQGMNLENLPGNSGNLSLDHNKYIPKTDFPKMTLPDSIPSINKPGFQPPSINTPSTDSLQNQLSSKGKSKKDSAITAAKGKIPMDSVNSQINSYKKQISEIQSTVKETNEKIEKLKEAAKNPLGNKLFSSKRDKVLSGIKKFEFGLCYPSYSTFLISNMPVKGINVQYEKDDWLLAFTYGTTVNNLLFSPAPMQNALENMRNLYNFFDFNKVEAGRKVAAIKTGWGQKEKTHFYVGFLYGLGYDSYIKSQENSSNRIYGRERNTVIEVDAKYALNPKHSFDFIYGKSSIKDLSFPVEEYKNTLQELTYGFRSNAAIFRYNGFFTKTKTKLTLSTRLIDPFFRSFGLAYMRSDNLRYELKAEQPIKKNLKYTVSLRYDEDNLLNLYQYKTKLYTWGNNLQWKMNKRTTLRVAYNPVLQDIKTGETTLKNKNSITNVVITYIPKARKISMQNTAIYSYYNLTTDSQQIHFQNVTYTQQIQFRNGFRSGITSSWYKNDLSDSLSNNTIINVLEGGYQFKNGSSVSVAGKAALYKMKDLQGGFSVKGSFKLYKNIMMELQADRIIMGEFYNVYNLEQNIKDFPYYFLGKVTYKW